MTITHACGTTYDIAYLDKAYEIYAAPAPLPSCTTCKKPLLFTRYAHLKKRQDLRHLAVHAVSGIERRVKQSDDERVISNDRSIKAKVKAILEGLTLPDPSAGLPDQEILAGLLGHPSEPLILRQKLFDSKVFGANSDTVFLLGTGLYSRWYAIAAPWFKKYASCLAGYDFCALDSAAVSIARADAGLRTIGIRLQLVRVAEAFWAEFQDPERYSSVELQQRAAYTAHLFSIIVWTLLRSCQRDLQILRSLASTIEEDNTGTTSTSCKVEMYNVLLRKMTAARIASRRQALALPGNTKEKEAITKMIQRTMGSARDGVRNVLEDVQATMEQGGGTMTEQERAQKLRLWAAVGDGVLGKWETLVDLRVLKEEDGGDQFTILLTTCVLLNRL